MGGRQNGIQPVGPAPGTGSSRSATDQTGPGGRAGELDAVGADDVQIVQTAHRIAGLQLYGQFFQLRGGDVAGPDALQTCGGVGFALFKYPSLQTAVQLRLCRPEDQIHCAPALQRPGDVHGQAQQGMTVSVQQLSLGRSPGLTGVQDLL